MCRFASKDKLTPAVFYLLSYPAHADYPVALVRKDDASLWSWAAWRRATSGRSTSTSISQGARSCQLVMGVTHLQPGSNWNTMPPHTHMRRSEVYMYFNLDEGARVIHLMGPPTETRHLVLADKGRCGFARMVGPLRAWARAPIVFAGAWAERTRIMRIWIRRRWRVCGRSRRGKTRLPVMDESSLLNVDRMCRKFGRGPNEKTRNCLSAFYVRSDCACAKDPVRTATAKSPTGSELSLEGACFQHSAGLALPYA